MSKKRKEKDLVMHKLLGDHTMASLTVCLDCGIMEGQQVIEPFVPVKMTTDQIFELMKTIMELASRMRELEGVIADLQRQGNLSRKYDEIQKNPLPGAIKWGGSQPWETTSPYYITSTRDKTTAYSPMHPEVKDKLFKNFETYMEAKQLTKDAVDKTE